MVLGRVEDGRIELTGPLPREWEGLSVKVEPCTPDDTLPDLDERLRALHGQGPMEYEPGERDAVERTLTALNEFSRREMQQLTNGLP